MQYNRFLNSRRSEDFDYDEFSDDFDDDFFEEEDASLKGK